MKKLFYTLLAVLIIFSACNKEDEEPTSNNSPSIIGAWTINTVVLESDASSSILSPEDISFPSSLEFVSGGILYETFSNELDTNEWVIISDSLYIGDEGEDLIAKYEVTHTNLTLVAPFDENMLGWSTITVNGIRD